MAVGAATMRCMADAPKRNPAPKPAPPDARRAAVTGGFDVQAIARQFAEEAEEDRTHLFRDGIISMLLGALTPLAPLAFLWLIALILTRRGFLRRDTADGFLELVAIALALLFVVSLIIAWRQVRPFESQDRRSKDPRFGRPTARANESDDETFEDASGWLGWSYAYFSPDWIGNFLSLGSRQFVQGIRSLIDRSRLGEARLAAAAVLLARCGATDDPTRAPAGLLSATIPDDRETLEALGFLWSHRYLRADGVLNQTRLLPSPKGLELLNEHRLR
jgi:hypothetical protein